MYTPSISNGLVKDQAGVIKIAVGYYKNLFAEENKSDICLGHNFWESNDLVTQEENDMICSPFSVDEIKEALFSSLSPRWSTFSLFFNPKLPPTQMGPWPRWSTFSLFFSEILGALKR
jgi:hypothetical protein